MRAQRIGFDIPLASRRPCRIAAKQSNATGESFDDLREYAVIAADELLHDLRSSKTDLARVVEAVIRDRLPYVVVPIQAVMSWERRELEHWAKVTGWLVAQNVSLVKV